MTLCRCRPRLKLFSHGFMVMDKYSRRIFLPISLTTGTKVHPKFDFFDSAFKFEKRYSAIYRSQAALLRADQFHLQPLTSTAPSLDQCKHDTISWMLKKKRSISAFTIINHQFNISTSDQSKKEGINKLLGLYLCSRADISTQKNTKI